MRRRTAVAGTIALHGALLGGLLVLPERGFLAPIAPDRPVVEIAEIVRPKPRPVAGGGGNTRSDAIAVPPAPVQPTVRTVAHRPTAEAAQRVGTLYVDGGTGGGRGGGDGTGDGRGTGAGGGPGLGAATARSDEAIAHLAIPPPAPVSKARPARLIYPANNREVEADQQFIARVDVDHEGYVVGAKLVQGFGGRRDEQASALIFRFRYEPALDDDGRPIRSTLDQPFLVGR